MKQNTTRIAAVALASALLLATVGPAQAAFKCTEHMVKSGSTCIDTYEASVWRIPGPLAVDGLSQPSASNVVFGFRCAR